MESAPSSVHSDADHATLARLAAYLCKRQNTLNERLLLAVRRDPGIVGADSLTYREFVDHLPGLFMALRDFLQDRGAVARNDGVRTDAQQHGQLRWRSGYRIDELLRELELFRKVIVADLARCGPAIPGFEGPLAAMARERVSEFFAEVACNAAQQFVNEQQRLLQSYTQKIERALHERQRLTTVVAHELRNLLQGMTYAAKVWACETNGERVRAQIQVQMQEMHDLLEQLLGHSELMAGCHAAQCEPFELPRLFDELVVAHRDAAQQKGLQFVGDCTTAPAQVIGYRLKTRQIAANLLTNAIKYTPEGQVSLEMAARDKDTWVIRVSDTGPGISAAQSVRLQTGVKQPDEFLPGRGIGLGITKDLVDFLGGSLEVATPPAGGTCIEVTLPARVIPGPE
ncbi:MAG TPA: HAMP domain-containing sensor histidine kinase [Steroidobacteraceae bacterium]|jgi:hypothetical protein